MGIGYINPQLDSLKADQQANLTECHKAIQKEQLEIFKQLSNMNVIESFSQHRSSSNNRRKKANTTISQASISSKERKQKKGKKNKHNTDFPPEINNPFEFKSFREILEQIDSQDRQLLQKEQALPKEVSASNYNLYCIKEDLCEQFQTKNNDHRSLFTKQGKSSLESEVSLPAIRNEFGHYTTDSEHNLNQPLRQGGRPLSGSIHTKGMRYGGQNIKHYMANNVSQKEYHGVGKSSSSLQNRLSDQIVKLESIPTGTITLTDMTSHDQSQMRVNLFEHTRSSHESEFSNIQSSVQLVMKDRKQSQAVPLVKNQHNGALRFVYHTLGDDKQLFGAHETNFKIFQNLYNLPQDENSYIKLQAEDMKLVVDAINNDTDQLRLYFGCKTFRKILSVCEPNLINHLVQKFRKRLSKRLVHLLSYTHMNEMITEILWALVNITAVKCSTLTTDMVHSGLIQALMKFIDERLQTQLSREHTELTLTVMSNLVIDTPAARNELFTMEKSSAVQRLKEKDRSTITQNSVFGPGKSEQENNPLAPKPLSQKMEEIIKFVDKGEKLIKAGQKATRSKSAHCGRTATLGKVSSFASMHSFSQAELIKAKDIQLQIAYIIEHLLQTQADMSKPNLKWVFRIALLMLQTFNTEDLLKDDSSLESDPVLLKIMRSVLLSIKLGCQSREQACFIIQKHNQRSRILESLLDITQMVQRFELSYNALLILGDLTASTQFQERVLFVTHNMFSTLCKILHSFELKKIPMGQQHLCLILWIQGNAIADEGDCQFEYLRYYPHLLHKSLYLASKVNHQNLKYSAPKGLNQTASQDISSAKRNLENKNRLKCISDSKVMNEVMFLVHNILDIGVAADHLFTLHCNSHDWYKHISAEPYEVILDSIAEVLSSKKMERKLNGLNCLRVLLKLNAEKVRTYILQSNERNQLIWHIYRLQHSEEKKLNETATYIAFKYFKDTEQCDISGELAQAALPEIDQGDVLLYAHAYSTGAIRGDSMTASVGSASTLKLNRKISSPGKKLNIGARRAKEAAIQKEHNDRIKFEATFKQMVKEHLVNEHHEMHVLDVKKEADLPDLLAFEPTGMSSLVDPDDSRISHDQTSNVANQYNNLIEQKQKTPKLVSEDFTAPGVALNALDVASLQTNQTGVTRPKSHVNGKGNLEFEDIVQVQ